MNKFKTLIHKGPLFPEEYIPKGYILNGEKLSSLAEEMLWHFAKLQGTDYLKDKVFVNNFYISLQFELSIEQKQLKFPEEFKDILDKMYKDIQVQKEIKKNRSKEEKFLEKDFKNKIKEEYGFAYLNGIRQPLGGYIIEPPGIYMGRGESPIRGFWKYRVLPENVTINIVSDKEADIPKPPKGHQWKGIKSNTNAFVSVWFDVDIGHKFIFTKEFRFSTISDITKNNDRIKYEKARKLVQDWNIIENHINTGLKSKNRIKRESALIAWLILQTGIRVGNEHLEGLDNQTVGASTLKQKNIELIIEE